MVFVGFRLWLHPKTLDIGLFWLIGRRDLRIISFNLIKILKRVLVGIGGFDWTEEIECIRLRLFEVTILNASMLREFNSWTGWNSLRISNTIVRLQIGLTLNKSWNLKSGVVWNHCAKSDKPLTMHQCSAFPGSIGIPSDDFRIKTRNWTIFSACEIHFFAVWKFSLDEKSGEAMAFWLLTYTASSNWISESRELVSSVGFGEPIMGENSLKIKVIKITTSLHKCSHISRSLMQWIWVES